MPVRVRVVERVVERYHGGPWRWNGASGECISDGWSREQHDEATARFDEVFEPAVAAVDWHRLLIVAQGLCAEEGCAHLDDAAGWDFLRRMGPDSFARRC